MFLLHWGIGQSKLEMRQEEQAQGSSTCNLPGVAKAGICPRPALPVMFSSAALRESVPSVHINHVHFLGAENLQIRLADSGCAACMRKLQEVGKAWHAAMSIFSWSSLPGPQLLVSSAVRSGGQVTGPDQWNVAESIRRHFYDWPIRTPHPHPHPHLHPCSKILVLVPV